MLLLVMWVVMVIERKKNHLPCCEYPAFLLPKKKPHDITHDALFYLFITGLNTYIAKNRYIAIYSDLPGPV